MKKRFSSILRFLGILMLLLLLAIIVGIVVGFSYLKNANSITDNSVLEIQFYNNIPEKNTEDNLITKYLNKNTGIVSLRETIGLLDQAANDDKIKALLIDGNSMLSHSKAIELQDAIKLFKEKSKKPVYAYGDYYRQGAYLTSTIADSIFIHPSGNIDLKGYSIIFSYFKDFLDRYDIDMEVFRAGKYKSYVESYLQNETSEENREQYTLYLNSLLDELIQTISEKRQIDRASVANILDKNAASYAENCLQLGLVDKIEYKTDFRNRILAQYDKDNRGFVGLGQYKKAISCKQSSSDNPVAYVVISGDIGEVEGESSSTHLRKTFQSIRDNKKIKTILLRIDSGGGSAFASEEIWHEIALCKNKGIEVISSISSVAASGGYYVAANSDKIFANKNSVVGSIGVFVAFPVLKNALDKHIGVHFDELNTGPFAARIQGINKLTDEQRAYYETSTMKLYELFKARIADGRNLDTSYVEEIAQGRIFTGQKGHDLQLVDSLTNLQGAMNYIRNKYEDSEDVAFIEYSSKEEEMFGDFDIPDLLKMAIKSNNPMNEIIQESMMDFSYYLNNPTPMMRMDFFNISN